ncbi:MAG: glycosyltransferase [Proteobacteria bacterium]|nr:glycosyltransferase [Pseudomonadota bacterium]
MSQPLVSVVLPTFNRLRFLKPAVESVFLQSFQDWELIIADDGSDEDTRAYLRTLPAPQVKILWLPHCANPSRLRNAAIRASGGRYIALLDSDDVWAAAKLERQVQAMDSAPHCGWSYTLENFIDETGGPYTRARLRTFPPKSGWIFESLLKLEVAMSMPTILATAELLGRIGGFDEQLKFGEWHDLSLRLALASEVLVVAEPLCAVRMHDEHYTADRMHEQLGWLQLYRKMRDLVAEPELREYCSRVCADTALYIARLQMAQGAYADALTVLTETSPLARGFPSWWWGVLKEIARPFIPRRLLASTRKAGPKALP